MSPAFAEAFDPVLLEVLALVERARAGTAGPLDEEQSRLRALIEQGGSRLPAAAKDWELAKYSLAALVDELLISEVSWESRAWWENNKLEFALFKSNTRAKSFFERAEKAAELVSRDALECFLVAVVLGFKGLHRDRPEELRAWLRRQEQLVGVGHGRPMVPDAGRDVAGAMPLSGRAALVWAGLAAAAAVAFGLAVSGVAILRMG